MCTTGHPLFPAEMPAVWANKCLQLIVVAVSMDRDEDRDWGLTGFDRESYEDRCGKCKLLNRVTLTIGPRHGGWTEKFEPACANCGESLEEVEAFGIDGVEIVT